MSYIDQEIACHKLDIHLDANPNCQMPRRMTLDRMTKLNEEVDIFLANNLSK